jgi:hypothetical protein
VGVCVIYIYCVGVFVIRIYIYILCGGVCNIYICVGVRGCVIYLFFPTINHNRK